MNEKILDASKYVEMHRNVERGIKILWSIDPKWYQKIDLDDLDMMKGYYSQSKDEQFTHYYCGCVCAQLDYHHSRKLKEGAFHVFVKQYFRTDNYNDLEKFGLYLRGYNLNSDELNNLYNVLTSIWKSKIITLREQNNGRIEKTAS